MPKRKIGWCSQCNREMQIVAKGLCSTCYSKSKIGTCAVCGELKPISARGMCGNCYDKWLKDTNPEYRKKQISNSKDWRIANSEHVTEKSKERWAKEKDDPEKIKQRRDKHYRQYGLTADDADKLKTEPCMLCGGTSETMHIDHDHDSGKFRGVLCSKCNNGLGFFNDSIELLQKAIRYLTKE